MKKWYTSKTIWFNIITLVLGCFAVFNDVYPIPAEYVALVTGMGNVFLRFLTKTEIN